MARIARALEIARQLEDANRAARRLLGANYEEKAEGWREVVRGLMKLWDCSAVQVPPRLEKAGNMPENALLLLAAVVDVVNEGSS